MFSLTMAKNQPRSIMIATLTTLSASIKYMTGVAPSSSKICLERSTMFEFMGSALSTARASTIEARISLQFGYFSAKRTRAGNHERTTVRVTRTARSGLGQLSRASASADRGALKGELGHSQWHDPVGPDVALGRRRGNHETQLDRSCLCARLSEHRSWTTQWFGCTSTRASEVGRERRPHLPRSQTRERRGRERRAHA